MSHVQELPESWVNWDSGHPTSKIWLKPRYFLKSNCFGEKMVIYISSPQPGAFVEFRTSLIFYWQKRGLRVSCSRLGKNEIRLTPQWFVFFFFNSNMLFDKDSSQKTGIPLFRTF